MTDERTDVTVLVWNSGGLSRWLINHF